MSHVLTNWNPEDSEFWQKEGKRVARRNLWISIPALLLAFSVWMVWSVVVVNLPNIGFRFTTNQLFWLAALPGLSGATLRIFYSFMVPIFGGRLWTTLSTASLLIPRRRYRTGRAASLEPRTGSFSPWRFCAGSGGATSPPAWPTSASSIPRRRRGRRWG